MKKYILVFAFMWLSFVNVGYAQVQDKQDAYQQALIQRITLLQEQVALLVKQLAIITAQQATLQTQITTQMTEKAIGSPTERIVYTAPVEVDKSKLTVVRSEGNVSPDFPHGQVIFTVTYFDKDGKPTKEVKEVTMEGPDNLTEPNIETRPTNPVGQIVFGYIPKTTGMKTVSFSSGSLNESITFEVK
jgi:hypothetical protein